MTQELQYIPLTMDQKFSLNFILGNVRQNKSSLFEILMGTLILFSCGYVDLDDYNFQVAVNNGNQKDTFIKIAEKALHHNNFEPWH